MERKDSPGYGETIEVSKFRELNLATTLTRWKYQASGPNRYFEDGRYFGNRTYDNLKDMASDINEITRFDEDFPIVSKDKILQIKSNRGGLVHTAFQNSELDNDELAELSKHIFICKQKKLEVATH